MSVADNYVAWVHFTGDEDHRRLRVCDSDSEGAFKVYREHELADLRQQVERLEREREKYPV